VATAEDQWKWRNSGSGRVGEKPRARLGAAVTVHLTEEETAALDAIAIKLYRAHPHDPRRGEDFQSSVFPGRAAAIRHLCHEYQESVSPRLVRTLIKLRDDLSAFWRAEAAWRQTRHNSRGVDQATKPPPPWRTSR
jgi:hypothetical protein